MKMGHAVRSGVPAGSRDVLEQEWKWRSPGRNGGVRTVLTLFVTDIKLFVTDIKLKKYSH
jgi:hypothetical protein